MESMLRNAFKLLMVWLIVGPPALCRAGVLVECCEHETAQPVPAVSASPCCGGCDSGETPEPATPEPAPRECGTCAGVCAVAAKPADELPPVTFLVIVIDRVRFSHDPAHPARSGRSFSRDVCASAHPYPSSDLPLLI